VRLPPGAQRLFGQLVRRPIRERRYGREWQYLGSVL